MENEDYRIMVLNDTTMKIFRDGRIFTLSKKCKKYEKWNERTGTPDKDGYLKIHISHKHYRAHRLITLCYLGKCPIGKEVDHINGIKNDNRLENLQYLTPYENNLKKTCYKGFCFNKGKYETCINVDKKKIYLGTYDTKEEARQVYVDAKLKYHNVNM